MAWIASSELHPCQLSAKSFDLHRSMFSSFPLTLLYFTAQNTLKKSYSGLPCDRHSVCNLVCNLRHFLTTESSTFVGQEWARVMHNRVKFCAFQSRDNQYRVDSKRLETGYISPPDRHWRSPLQTFLPIR